MFFSKTQAYEVSPSPPTPRIPLGRGEKKAYLTSIRIAINKLSMANSSIVKITEKLNKNVNGVETDLCATLYRYVKSLVDKGDERIENWRNISEWLDLAGYKSNSPPQLPANLLPEKSIVNITNINIEKNELVVYFNLRIPTTESLKLSTDENLNGDITP